MDRRLHVLILTLLATGLLSACDTSLSRDNPYDPDLPPHQKQPASLMGQVVLESGDATIATVEVQPAGKSATPGTGGYFEIADIPPGSYTIRVSAAGHSTWIQAGVHFEAGQRVDIDEIFVLAARGNLEGQVILMLAPESEAGSHGGALVNVRPVDHGTMAASRQSASTISNPDGSWNLNSLPIGLWEIDGSKDGFAPSPPVEVEVTEDGTTPAEALVLRSITGVIAIDGGADYTNDGDGEVTVEVLAFQTDEMRIGNSADLDDVDWEPHLAERPWTLEAGEDGEKAVFMQFRNHSGYVTPPVHDSIVLDRAAPSNPLVRIAPEEDDEYVQQASVAVALEADDALSGVARMRTAVDGDVTDEPWVDFERRRAIVLPVGDDPDGVTATVQAQFMDGAGNESDIVQDSVIVDSVAPASPSIAINDEALLTASRAVTLTLSADGASEMKVSNDPGLSGASWQPFVTSLGWGLTEGDEDKTVYARYRDAAGNESVVVQDSIEMNTKGSVSGTFTLEGVAAGGYGGTTVTLTTTPEQSQPTDADGQVSFASVPVGMYTLRATNPTHEDVVVPLVAVEPGGDTNVGTRMMLVARGRLEGAATRQGAAADGHGGIQVEVVGEPGRLGFTAPDGAWAIEGVPVGQYTVRATAEGYLAAAASDVSVVKDAVTTVPALALSANPGSIAGSVTLEGLSEPALGIAEILVAGQTVPAAGDGGFEVLDVAAGTYTLTARAPGYGIEQVIAVVAPGAQTDLDPIALRTARGDLAGTAELEGESEHAGILVEVQGTGFSAISNALGEWTIRGVPAAQYAIRASAAGYNPTITPDITVLEDEEVVVPLMTLTANPGSLSGVIELEGLAAGFWDGVTVTIEGTGLSEVTAADGSFGFAAVPAGTYPLTAMVSGYSTARTVITVLAGQPTDAGLIPLSIARGAIAGLATLAGEGDHSGITVEVDNQGYAGVTGVTGSYRIEGVPTGTYSLTAHKDGYTTRQVGAVTVLEDQTVTAADVQLVRQSGDFAIRERLTNDENYLNDPAVKLVFTVIPADSTKIIVSEDPAFTGASWENFSGLEHDHDLISGDGTINVYAKFRNPGDVESPVFSASTVLDRVPPSDTSTVLIENDAAFSTSPDGQVTLNLLGQDSGSGVGWVQISVDGALDTEPDVAYQTPITGVTLDLPLVDGNKSVWVEFVDLAGNRSAMPASDSIYLDRVEPVDSLIQINGGAAYTTGALVSLTLFARDACGPGHPSGSCFGGYTEPAQLMVSNDPGFQGGLWEAYAVDRNWFLKPGDGTRNVYVKYRDGAGNESPRISASIILDGNPPGSPQVVILGGEITGTPNVFLGLSATHGPTEMLVAEGGDFSGATWETYDETDYPVTLSSGDGLKTMSARFRDEAGNETATVQDTVMLDTAAPAGTVTIEEGEYVAVPGITLLLTGSPDATRVCVYGDVNGACDPASEFLTWTVLASPLPATLTSGDGSKTVRVVLADDAGNKGSEFTDSTVLDGTKPFGLSVGIAGEGPTGYTRTSAVTLTLAATDTTSGVVEMMLANDAAYTGVDWQPFSGGASWTLAGGDGDKDVYLKVRDRSGNEEQTSGQIVLDRAAPSIGAVDFLISDGAAYSMFTAVTVDLAALDNLTAGGDLVWCLANDPTFAGATCGVGLDLVDRAWSLSPGDGEKIVYARVEDEAGHRTVASDAIELDSQAPTGGSLIIDGGEYTASASVNLTLYADDAFQMCIFGDITSPCNEANDGEWTDFNSTETVDLAAGDGLNTVRVKYRDEAKNVTGEAWDTITLDRGAPSTVTLTIVGEGPPGFSRLAPVTLQIAAADATSDVVEMMVSEFDTFSDATWESFSMTRGWTLSEPDGPKTVYVRARDQAGNFKDTSAAVTLDRAAPSFTAAFDLDGDVGEPSGYSYDATVAASFTVTDNVDNDDQLDYWLANEPHFAGATAADVLLGGSVNVPWILAAGDGVRTAYVKIADRAGNEATSSATITVDGEPPASLSLVLDPTDYVTGATVTAHIDAVGASQYCLTGDLNAPPAPDCLDAASPGWLDLVPSVSGVTLSAGDGDKTVNAYFRDDARNATGPATDTVMRDGTPPNSPCTMTVTNGNVVSTTRYVRDSFLDLAISAVDPDPSSGLTEMQLANNSGFSGATWVPYATAASAPLTSGDGLKEVFLRVRDRAGNTQLTECSSVSAVLDTEAPTAGVSTTDGLYRDGLTYVVQTALNLDISCQDIHCHELYIDGDVVDGANVRDWVDFTSFSSTQVVLDGATEGIKDIRVWVRDRALNVSPQAMLRVYLDTAPPSSAGASVELWGPAANGLSEEYTRDRAVTVILSGFTDVGSGLHQMQISEDIGFGDALWEPYRTPVTRTLSPSEDTKTLYVRVRDWAGSTTASPVSATITLDTIAPTVNLDITGTAAWGGSDEYTRERLVDLTIDVNDLAGTGAFEMELSRDGGFSGNWIGFNSPMNGFDLYDPTVPTCHNRGVWLNEIHTGKHYAELVNTTGRTVDLTGWSLTSGVDGSPATWTIPDFQLPAGGYVALLEGNDPNTDTVLHFAAPACPWGGGAAGYAILRDGEGNAVDFMRFNGSAEPIPAGAEWIEDTGLTVNDGVLGRTSLEFERELASDWCSQTDSAPAQNTDDCGLAAGDCEGVAGNRPIHVQVQDHAGNVGYAEAEIVLDIDPPEGSVEIDGGADWATSSVVNLGMVFFDNLSGLYTMKLGQAADTYGTPQEPVDVLTYTLTGPQGPNKVYVRYMDLAGNLSPSFADGIELDTEVPTCSATLRGFRADGTQSLPLNDTDTALRTVEILSSSCSGGPTGIAVADENEGLNCATASYNTYAATAFVTLGDGDGDKRAHVCYRDDAGNVTASPVLSTQITLDQTPPLGNSVFVARTGGDQPDTHTPDEDVWVYLSSSGAHQMRYRDDPNFTPGTDWEAYSTTPQDESFDTYALSLCTTDPAGYADGVIRTVYGQFRDELFNESPVVTYDIVYDRCRPDIPTVTINPTPGAHGAFSNSRDVVVGIANLEHASGMYFYGMNGSACSGYSSHPVVDLASSGTLSFTSDGLKRACVRLVDDAGNVSSDDGEDTITVDTLPPTAPTLTPGNLVNANYGCARIRPYGVTELNHWKWQARSNGGPWRDVTLSSSKIEFDLLQDTDNTLEVRSVDQAGNLGNSNTAFVEEVSSTLIATPLTVRHMCNNGQFAILKEMNFSNYPHYAALLGGSEATLLNVPDIELLDIASTSLVQFSGESGIANTLGGHTDPSYGLHQAMDAACTMDSSWVLFSQMQSNAGDPSHGDTYLVVWPDPLNNPDSLADRVGPILNPADSDNDVAINNIDVLQWTGTRHSFRILASDTQVFLDYLRKIVFDDDGTYDPPPFPTATVYRTMDSSFWMGMRGLAFGGSRSLYMKYYSSGPARWSLVRSLAVDTAGAEYHYYPASSNLTTAMSKQLFGTVFRPSQWGHVTGDEGHQGSLYLIDKDIVYKRAYDAAETEIGTQGAGSSIYYEQRGVSPAAESAWTDSDNPKRFRLNEDYYDTSSMQAFRYTIDTSKPIFGTGQHGSGDPMVVYHTSGMIKGVVIGYKNNSGCAE